MLEQHIIGRWDISNYRTVLIEGIAPADYDSTIALLSSHTRKSGGQVSDFLQMLSQRPMELQSKFVTLERLFVYNVDLFGEGIDPNQATDVLQAIRAASNENLTTRQLMIARPNANLDYGSRKGYGLFDNHPLGNWCEFNVAVGSLLETHIHPVKHPDHSH
jgi:hypothetical protein